MKAAMQELREIIRWRLISLADWFYARAVARAGSPAYRPWLWVALRLDRLAIWIGRPFTGYLHK